jgi:hypothetical protein
MSFDVLAERCQAQGGFAAADSNKVAAWQRENHVDKVRARLAELSHDAAAAQRLAALRQNLKQKLAPVQGKQSCAAAVATTAIPNAQFARNAPDMLQALGGSVPAEKTTRPAAIAPPPAGRAAADSTARAPLADSIDSFGFDSRMRMDVGGFLYPVPVPVVLFRNGDALTDIEGLSFSSGPAAHKRAHPDLWTQWRRNGARIQLHDAKKGWRDLTYKTTYAKLPAGYALDGAYHSLSGSGTVAIGGTDSVAAWREYAFGRDGRVVRGGGAGAYAQIAGGATAISSVAPNQRGRYRIDGITLHIQYDDGAKEARIIVTDPEDPKAAIWLDGIGYKRKNR